MDARESRSLKIAGLAVMAIALVPLMLVGERLATVEWLRGADAKALLVATTGWLVLADVFAIGVIVLLAGLRDVPLLTSARAARGGLVKLAGATLLIALFGMVAMYDAPGDPAQHLLGHWASIPSQWAEYLMLPAALGLVVLFRLAVKLMRAGWKYDAQSADEVRARDPRPPVVYLRSFRDDGRLTMASGSGWRRIYTSALSLVSWYNVATPEQAIADALKGVGPVIAIGQPGEELPELGAARLYVGDDAWRTTVDELMRSAALVVIQGGDTPGLLWEVERAVEAVSRQRVVIACFGNDEHTAAFDGWFEGRYGTPRSTEAEVLTGTRLRGVLSGLRGVLSGWKHTTAIGKIVYFGGDRAPRLEPVYVGIGIVDICEGIFRRYHPPVRRALGHVLQALQIPRTPWRTQTAAVMLALCGGIIGLHHFYLGDRRKGFRYLAFCWLIVPMLAGFVDAVRMSMLDPREFAERHAMRGADRA